ncbi:MAG: formimidoylglutamase [Bergeyella sp.]|nr:formimidoylglutamase [Bergeyella sp.]
MIWEGRFDGDSPLCKRVFQSVKYEEDYGAISPNGFFLHGFSVDEGVRRNKGRVGAKTAPNGIRKNMANFPVHASRFCLLDFGNVVCTNGDLEKSQKKLSEKVAQGLISGGRSVVLGGGHELTYAHFMGIRKAFPNKKIGIINVDAHFDNREAESGLGTSGTSFWQIYQQEKQLFSLHIGIQKNANTLELFDRAHTFGMEYILAEEIFYENIKSICTTVDTLEQRVDLLYLTVCMDTFNASISPGVSAPSCNGIFADQAFISIYKRILSSQKLKALDVAEVNPLYDEQERTARLASGLVNEWFMNASI